MSRLVAAEPENQAQPLSEHGKWPGGEPDSVRDAYDRLVEQAVPAPRDAT